MGELRLLRDMARMWRARAGSALIEINRRVDSAAGKISPAPDTYPRATCEMPAIASRQRASSQCLGSPGDRGGTGADALDVLRQQVAVLGERGGGVVHFGRIVRGTTVALLEGQAAVSRRL